MGATSDAAGPAAARCLLLACSLAADANVRSLRLLTASRRDVFGNAELVLRILLSYLPESLEPERYIPYVKEICGQTTEVIHEDATLPDVASVSVLSDDEVQSKLNALRLLRLRASTIPDSVPEDDLTLFLVHRAHRIDAETGLFELVPRLMEPFLGYSDWLKDWFTGVVLPMLRLDYHNYSGRRPDRSIVQFEATEFEIGLAQLLESAGQEHRSSGRDSTNIGRSFRGVIVPWIYGTQRWRSSSTGTKRRRLENDIASVVTSEDDSDTATTSEVGSWQATNEWIVRAAAEDFPLAVDTIHGWAGPTDIDLEGNRILEAHYTKGESEIQELTRSYVRAAFAAIYTTTSDTLETINGAHKILSRTAHLLGFEPPPDLESSIELLPRIESHSAQLESMLVAHQQPEQLLTTSNPLTHPTLETYSLLQMLIFSASLLRGLGEPHSVVKVVKLRFWSDDGEQLSLLQRLLHQLSQSSRHGEKHWMHVRDTLMWLWDWMGAGSSDYDALGHGVFGKVKSRVLQIEILRALCAAGQYLLVNQVYVLPSEVAAPLPMDEVEQVIVKLAYQYYDEASNGNKTRGGVKKAADLVAAFQAHFPKSIAFGACKSLIAATHALSFYSLTLHRGVPFLPVKLRTQEDPVSLLAYVLDQNPKSYTQLDNLIEIARNLVKGTVVGEDCGHARTAEQEAADVLTAEHRATSMSIEAALHEDDFETAYSYVVNRLLPSSTASTSGESDDISWRAALLAGRQRPRPKPSTASGILEAASQTAPQVRRLEQRMDLLSRAMLLAPAHALPEVLGAWRRCEEELLALLAREHAEQAAFDDRGVAGAVGSTTLPGAFSDLSGPGSSLLAVQPRRKEMGRSAAEEAPMGLFEVMRGASAALQRTAGVAAASKRQHGRALHGAQRAQHEPQLGEPQQAGVPQRKRDVVASAVTGSLASGIGWVLGATPARDAPSAR